MWHEANPAALDLLEQMLQFNPAKRIDVKAALAHPYLESLHNPDDEPECKEEFDFSFEGATLSKELIQELIQLSISDQPKLWLSQPAYNYILLTDIIFG